MPALTFTALRKLRRPLDFTLTQRAWLLPATVFLLLFFVSPLIHNVWRSATEQGAASAPAFYYEKLFSDSYYRGVLWTTLRVSLIVTVIALLFSYPVAFFLVRYAGRYQGLVVSCLIAPLLTSVIMRTLGIQLVLARHGAFNGTIGRWLHLPPLPQDLLNGPFAVYLGITHVLIPFMVLSIAPVLQRVSPSVEESATVLGAGRWRTFWHITLPLSLEGVYTGCILVFVLANGSFITQLLLGRGSIVTMPVLVYQQFNVTRDTAFASAMGNVLLLLSVACLGLQSALARSRRS